METYTVIYHTADGRKYHYVEAEEGLTLPDLRTYKTAGKRFVEVGDSWIALDDLIALIPKSVDKSA